MNNLEETKKELDQINNVIELSQNWIVQGVQGALIGRIPGLDNAVGAMISQRLAKEQKKKVQKLCDTIFNDTNINMDRVKDIDIVMEMVKTVDVVLKLSQNEKIVYIGTLFRKCFLQQERQYGCRYFFGDGFKWFL